MSDAGYATRHLSRGAIGGIFAGDVEAALARGCDAYRAAFTAAIPARRPVVIVSAGGATGRRAGGGARERARAGGDRTRRRRGAVHLPRALTIAGSDSGAGAGIQADLKTFAACGVYGTSVVAALTAQSTRGVDAVLAVPPSFVRAQLDAVLDDVGADAVKTGMLLDAATVETVAAALAERRLPLVVDPVMTAKGGTTLLRRTAVAALCARLVPLATVVTPNRAEAAALAGFAVRDREDMARAARALLALGPRAIVVTGGDLDGDACDLLVTGRGSRWLRARRVPGPPPHGTGCTFSAAIAAELAKGVPLEDAVVRAKRYTSACIRRARRIGAGNPILGHFPPARRR